MKKLYLFFALVFFISKLSFSQSSYLDKNQSGLLFSGGFASSKFSSGIAGGLGYSFLGKFDIGIGLGHFGQKEQLLNNDLNYTTISPTISFLPVKQDENTPLSLALNGTYTRSIFSNKIFDQYNISMNGDEFSFGASIFTRISAAKKMDIQPNLSINFNNAEVRATGLPQDISEKGQATIFGLSIDMIFKSNTSKCFIFTPILSFSNNGTSFGLGLGYLIPKK